MALVTAVAPTTATPRKPNNGWRFVNGNGLPNNCVSSTHDMITSTELAIETPTASLKGSP
jgi:hypothetical protein